MAVVAVARLALMSGSHGVEIVVLLLIIVSSEVHVLISCTGRCVLVAVVRSVAVLAVVAIILRAH